MKNKMKILALSILVLSNAVFLNCGGSTASTINENNDNTDEVSIEKVDNEENALKLSDLIKQEAKSAEEVFYAKAKIFFDYCANLSKKERDNIDSKYYSVCSYSGEEEERIESYLRLTDKEYETYRRNEITLARKISENKAKLIDKANQIKLGETTFFTLDLTSIGNNNDVKYNFEKKGFEVLMYDKLERNFRPVFDLNNKNGLFPYEYEMLFYKIYKPLILVSDVEAEKFINEYEKGGLGMQTYLKINFTINVLVPNRENNRFEKEFVVAVLKSIELIGVNSKSDTYKIIGEYKVEN